MTRRKYTRKFKLSAVQLVNEQGYSPSEAARRLGVDANSVRGWIKKYAEESGLVASRSVMFSNEHDPETIRIDDHDAGQRLDRWLSRRLNLSRSEIRRMLDDGIVTLNGRVTTTAVLAPHALPQFRRSTMDGYAVRAADSFGASESLPAFLQVVGEVPMGQAANVDLGVGQAAIVHTGGMIPQTADAVVQI